MNSHIYTHKICLNFAALTFKDPWNPKTQGFANSNYSNDFYLFDNENWPEKNSCNTSKTILLDYGITLKNISYPVQCIQTRRSDTNVKTPSSGKAVWRTPQHLFVSYHSIINVMPKITSQIFWFTKYWLLLALDLILLLSLSCY